MASNNRSLESSSDNFASVTSSSDEIYSRLNHRCNTPNLNLPTGEENNSEYGKLAIQYDAAPLPSHSNMIRYTAIGFGQLPTMDNRVIYAS